MEELKMLSPKSNLAEELLRRIGPFDFEKSEARVGLLGNPNPSRQMMSLNLATTESTSAV